MRVETVALCVPCHKLLRGSVFRIEVLLLSSVYECIIEESESGNPYLLHWKPISLSESRSKQQQTKKRKKLKHCACSSMWRYDITSACSKLRLQVLFHPPISREPLAHIGAVWKSHQMRTLIASFMHFSNVLLKPWSCYGSMLKSFI